MAMFELSFCQCVPTGSGKPPGPQNTPGNKFPTGPPTHARALSPFGPHPPISLIVLLRCGEHAINFTLVFECYEAVDHTRKDRAVKKAKKLAEEMRSDSYSTPTSKVGFENS